MQGKRVVAGNDDEAATMALQMHRFTPDVTLVTNDGAGADARGSRPAGAVGAASGGWANRQRAVAGRRAGDAGISKAGGRQELPADHLFSHQGATPQTALARSLRSERARLHHGSILSSGSANRSFTRPGTALGCWPTRS